MGWLLLFIVLFVPPARAASIQVSDNKPEVQIEDWRLKIICPKCGYVFYVCDTPEIFNMEPLELAHCHPTSVKVPEFVIGNDTQCPLDGQKPYRYTNTTCPNGKACTQFSTSKGWLPTRDRPHWQE